MAAAPVSKELLLTQIRVSTYKCEDEIDDMSGTSVLV